MRMLYDPYKLVLVKNGYGSLQLKDALLAVVVLYTSLSSHWQTEYLRRSFPSRAVKPPPFPFMAPRSS